MKGSCHCGRVTVTVPGRPAYLNECNCTVCYKLGTMWGYFPATEVRIEGATHGYERADRDEPTLHFNFCPSCGATVSWTYAKPHGPNRMGVNMRLFDPAELVGVELRFGDRRNHGNVEPRHHYREPTIFDGAGAA